VFELKQVFEIYNVEIVVFSNIDSPFNGVLMVLYVSEVELKLQVFLRDIGEEFQ
jgi:hypothetical protein